MAIKLFYPATITISKQMHGYKILSPVQKQQKQSPIASKAIFVAIRCSCLHIIVNNIQHTIPYLCQ